MRLVRKTKRGKYIAVQPTALARRNYKHRGRMVSSYGRRVKDTGKRAQMICDDTSDTVYFTLPKQKPRAVTCTAHKMKLARRKIKRRELDRNSLLSN